MADNAQGATSFQGDPPSHGPNAFFPIGFGSDNDQEGVSVLDTGADAPATMNVTDPLGDTTIDLDLASYKGTPCPDDRGHDSLTGEDVVLT